MPSTANKISGKVLSIRFSPGGLSFWKGSKRERYMPLKSGVELRASVSKCLKKIGGKGDFNRVRLFMDAPTVTVPAELFEPEQAEGYLTVNNLIYDEAVWADAGVGVIAVMACKGEVLEVFRGMFGERLELHSAFEIALESGETTMYLTGSRVYMALWQNGGLVFCDSLPYSVAADLIYYAAQYLSPRARIYTIGIGAKAAAEALNKKFRSRCA